MNFLYHAIFTLHFFAALKIFSRFAHRLTIRRRMKKLAKISGMQKNRGKWHGIKKSILLDKVAYFLRYITAIIL